MCAMSQGEACSVIIERLGLSLSDYPNVYWIGRRAMRLTFLSQQQRALNLLWALHETGKLSADSQVIVVGAGLAGLTAAFAAQRLGASVTLIEKKPVPLHLQRGCQLRFVHPNILDWPDPISEHPLTDLPCLNWGAGMAARVSNAVLEQWRDVAPEITERYGFEVREIRRSIDGRRPLVVGEGGSRNLEQACDILILAVGFGLERPLSPVPFLSYWENDNFGRPLITEPIPRRYLVTGCGDGGLIDAIRLRINAFDHADFVYQLSSLKNIGDIKKRLVDIDRNVSNKLREQGMQEEISSRQAELERFGGRSFDKVGARRRIVAEMEGSLLEEEYRRLEIPGELVELVTRDLRSDTLVFLNGPSASPLSLRSSILNRFVVFLLRQYGGLRYRAGEVKVSPVVVERAYKVLFQHDQFPAEDLEVHEVVVRHGPIPVIGRLFPRSVVEACQPSPEDWADPTRERQYPKDFLSQGDLLARKDRIRLEYAIASGPLAAKENFDPFQHDLFGIQMVEGEVSYVLRPIHAAVSSAERQSLSFHGIPFKFDAPVELSVEQPVLSLGVNLACGTGIQNVGPPSSALPSRDPYQYGTLGCFVRLGATNDIAILTTAHSLGNPRELQVGDRIVRAGALNHSRADVVAVITGLLLPVPSSPQSSIAAGTVRFNHFDAAVATLQSSVRITAGFGDAYPDAPSLFAPQPDGIDSKELIGTEVFKVGAGSGLTRGRVENVQANLRFTAWGDQYWFEGLFGISSLDSRPFSIRGDGGALVVREDGAILGLVIGGGGGSIITHACLIGPMLSELGCELYIEQGE